MQFWIAASWLLVEGNSPRGGKKNLKHLQHLRHLWPKDRLFWEQGKRLRLPDWPLLFGLVLLAALGLANLWGHPIKAQDNTLTTPSPTVHAVTIQRTRQQRSPRLELAQSNLAVGASPHIIGGQEAAPGAWPWAAAIVVANNTNAHSGEYCSGSLIQAQWVLTAAHCTFDDKGQALIPAVFDVVLGRHQLSTTDGERIHVTQIIRHPQYDPKLLDWDVALFKLETPSTATPIALIDTDQADWLASNPSATVIGWGVTQAEATEASDVLRQVELPLVSYRTCTYSYGIFYHVITPRMLCAGFIQSDKSACYGDSGGPLMVLDQPNNRWVQVGLVSWGSNSCVAPYYYNVYARLSAFTAWIDQQISEVATPTPMLTATPTFVPTDVPTTPTATPSPTAAHTYFPWVAHQVAKPAQLLQNGNFEAGTNAGWVEHSLHPGNLVLNKSGLGLTPHSGNYATQLGKNDIEVAVIEQDVTVPTGNAVLHYWVWITSTDSCGFDFGGVVVNDVILDQFELCKATTTTQWQQRSVDLAAYAGQTINLQLRSELDAFETSILYIDDVSFAATAAQSTQQNP